MDEGPSSRCARLLAGAYDVLVCTTIIESGIDMPSVNTLVVDRADRLVSASSPAARPVGVRQAGIRVPAVPPTAC